MTTRSSDLLFKLDEGSQNETIFKKRGPLDFSTNVQIPTKHEVIERYFTIKSNLSQNEPATTSLKILSDQLHIEWIQMNIPVVDSKNISKTHLEPLLQNMKKLQKVPIAKRKDKWKTDMKEFISKLDHGFDIMAKDDEAKDAMKEKFAIEFGKEEKDLFEDNCVPDETGKCPRRRWVGGVDPAWKKEFDEEEKFQERRENRKLVKHTKQIKIKEALEEQKVDFDKKADNIDEVIGEEEALKRQDSDEIVGPFKFPKTVKQKVKPAQTRSRSHDTLAEHKCCSDTFPDIPVRSGYKTFNMDIIEVLVVVESKFGVERRKEGGLLCYIMNRLAGQKWEEATEETNVDTESSEETTAVIDDNSEDIDESVKKYSRDCGWPRRP